MNFLFVAQKFKQVDSSNSIRLWMNWFRTNLEGNFVHFNKCGQLILFSFFPFFFFPFIVGSWHIFFIVSFFLSFALFLFDFFTSFIWFFPSFSLTIVCFFCPAGRKLFIDLDFISTLRHTCLSNRCVKMSCCSWSVSLKIGFKTEATKF